MEKCDCGGEYYFRNFCGAFVCDKCGHHRDLANCFCGWRKFRGDKLEGEECDEHFGDESVDENGLYRD